MPSRASNKEDTNQIAARVVALSTGQPPPTSDEKKLRSEAAAILGRLGGSKGGKMRAANLSSTRRREIAKKAARARWKDQNNG